jgi:hypothetical protein
MREILLSYVTADDLELIGFCVLVAGLAGEIAILFIPWRRAHNILTVICVVAIISGVWLERVGAEERRAPRKLRASQREHVVRKVNVYPATFFVVTEVGAEPLDFGLDIAASLKSAGWVWLPYPMEYGMGIDPIDGRPRIGFTLADHIEIQGRGANVKDAATALAESLREAKLDDVRLVITPEVPSEGQVVVVVVGGKK